jgi:hypothetical protein
MKMRDGIPGMFFNPSPTEPFDQDQFTYDPDAVDCVLLELLAAIQYVVESEDVHRLEAFIRGELGAV